MKAADLHKLELEEVRVFLGFSRRPAVHVVVFLLLYEMCMLEVVQSLDHFAAVIVQICLISSRQRCLPMIITLLSAGLTTKLSHAPQAHAERSVAAPCAG